MFAGRTEIVCPDAPYIRRGNLNRVRSDRLGRTVAEFAVFNREAVSIVPIECSNFKDLQRLITKFAMI